MSFAATQLIAVRYKIIFFFTNILGEYFSILNKNSGKALDATIHISWANQGYPIVMWDNHGDANQLWFWDGHYLRNKHYSQKVLTLSVTDFSKSDVCFTNENWGKVFLDENVTNDLNQQWYSLSTVNGTEIINKFNNLRLNVCNNNQNNLARVGCKAKNGINDAQLWNFLSNNIIF